MRYVDPTGMYDEENGYTDQEINDFKNMSVSEQLSYLKSEVESVSAGTVPAGIKSKHMRNQLRDSMHLEGLFYGYEGDEIFMNEILRDFLNMKEDGSPYLQADVLKRGSGWLRMIIGDSEHQHNQNGGRNQKFIHIDGREVVFDAKGNFIGLYPFPLGKVLSFYYFIIFSKFHKAHPRFRAYTSRRSHAGNRQDGSPRKHRSGSLLRCKR